MNFFPTPNPLNLRVVYRAVQYLILRNDFTTVTAVKNLLRGKNYNANERNVGRMMEQLLRQEADWMCTPKGEYQFQNDSDEEMNVTLRKNNEMVKITVKGKKLTIYNWTRKKQETRTYSSNRKAIFHAEALLKIKVKEGFYH